MKNKNEFFNNFSYEIVKELGVINHEDRYPKMLDIMKFSNRPEELIAIHKWQIDKQGNRIQMYKGINLTREEAETLLELLKMHLEEGMLDCV